MNLFSSLTLNRRVIDIRCWSVLFDWKDVRIALWRHKLFRSRACYFEIIISSFAFHLFCLYLWWLSTYIEVLLAFRRFVVDLMWMDLTWAPLVVDFFSGKLVLRSWIRLMWILNLWSFWMCIPKKKKKRKKLLDVLMEIVSDESLAEIQVRRYFYQWKSSNVYWMFALSIIFLLQLGFRRYSVQPSSDL